MTRPGNHATGLALEFLDEEVRITLTFESTDVAEAVYDRMVAALRAGTGFQIGGDKPLTLKQTGEPS